jgi:hypothetical protein
VIQDVGEGGLETQLRSLRDSEVLCQSKRYCSRSWSLKTAYACITEAAGGQRVWEQMLQG